MRNSDYEVNFKTALINCYCLQLSLIHFQSSNQCQWMTAHRPTLWLSLWYTTSCMLHLIDIHVHCITVHGDGTEMLEELTFKIVVQLLIDPPRWLVTNLPIHLTISAHLLKMFDLAFALQLGSTPRVVLYLNSWREHWHCSSARYQLNRFLHL